MLGRKSAIELIIYMNKLQYEIKTRQLFIIQLFIDSPINKMNVFHLFHPDAPTEQKLLNDTNSNLERN